MSIRRFAFLIAGPRDFVINLIVNGLIAWLIFGKRETVPLAAEGSIFAMVLPMVFIESTATTFFGYLAGALKRKTHAVTPPLDPEAPWLRRAVVAALVCGLVALAAAIAIMYLLAVCCPDVQMGPRIAVGGIALFSGSLAYVLHSRAVLRSGLL